MRVKPEEAAMGNDDGYEMLRSTGKTGQKFRQAVSGTKPGSAFNDPNWRAAA